jgi:hypothetical protein
VHRFLDALHRLEHLGIELALVADRADQRALGSAGDVDVEPWARIFASTAATAASVASRSITMIIVSLRYEG